MPRIIIKWLRTYSTTELFAVYWSKIVPTLSCCNCTLNRLQRSTETIDIAAAYRFLLISPRHFGVGEYFRFRTISLLQKYFFRNFFRKNIFLSLMLLLKDLNQIKLMKRKFYSSLKTQHKRQLNKFDIESNWSYIRKHLNSFNRISCH